MKKLLIVFGVLVLISCKKEKKSAEPETPSTPVVTPSTKQISVKINGTEFSCTNCGNTYSSGGLSGVNFAEGTSNRFIFSITGFLVPGTYVISPTNNPSFTYEKNGYYYRGKGSLTLTASDTSSNGSLKKFIGTFQCKTDTVNGVSYNFSEGNININF